MPRKKKVKCYNTKDYLKRVEKDPRNHEVVLCKHRDGIILRRLPITARKPTPKQTVIRGVFAVVAHKHRGDKAKSGADGKATYPPIADAIRNELAGKTAQDYMR